MLVSLRRKGGLSPRTASHARSVLRAALNAAMRRGQVGRNAAADAESVEVPRPSPKLLPVEDIRKVLEAVSGSEIENVVTLAINSGLRMGELLGLRWADVSLDTAQLTVNQSLRRLQRQSRLVKPKSERSHRTPQLPGPAVAALRAERKCQAARELAADAGAWKQPIPDLVFTTEVGAPLIGVRVLYLFQRALSQVGIPRLRFNHLRHLHGALLLLNGTDVAVVRDVLGHSSIALTADTYAGVMPALKREAADRFEKLLSQPS